MTTSVNAKTSRLIAAVKVLVITFIASYIGNTIGNYIVLTKSIDISPVEYIVLMYTQTPVLGHLMYLAVSLGFTLMASGLILLPIAVYRWVRYGDLPA